jgi:hypothetical protein
MHVSPPGMDRDRQSQEPSWLTARVQSMIDHWIARVLTALDLLERVVDRDNYRQMTDSDHHLKEQ